MAYATRTITHGTENVAMSGRDELGALKRIQSTGVAKFNPSIDQDSKNINADARTHMTLTNPKKLTIEIDNYQYSDDEMIQMGYIKVNGGFVDTGTYKPFDIQRITTVQSADGTKTKKLDVYYEVTSGAFTESDDEDDDEINPKTYTRTLNVKGRDFVDGKGVVKHFSVVRTDENKAIFDTHETKILSPSDFKPTGSNPAGA